MTNADMAHGYLRQAEHILEEAVHHNRARVWNLVVRRCQEVVELALKAVLRSAGVEIPHVHDVAVFLIEHAGRLPGAVGAHLERLISISRRLRQEREISFYGDEEVGAAPDRLYTARDAEEALEDARFVLQVCRDALPEVGGSGDDAR